jgi:hypothetical protein
MVNAVKITMQGVPNGPFYINEYAQVIVPVGQSADYYLAGEYSRPLRFEFEGHVLSGEGVDLTGRRLQPRDEWVGPHPGIPYVLAAGGKDIYYVLTPRPHVAKKVFLSKTIEPEKAATIVKRIREVKGYDGGGFYVNEWGSHRILP